MHIGPDLQQAIEIAITSIITGIVGVFGTHTIHKRKLKAKNIEHVEPFVRKCDEHPNLCISIAKIETVLSENLPFIKRELSKITTEIIPALSRHGERLSHLEGAVGKHG